MEYKNYRSLMDYVHGSYEFENEYDENISGGDDIIEIHSVEGSSENAESCTKTYDNISSFLQQFGSTKNRENKLNKLNKLKTGRGEDENSEESGEQEESEESFNIFDNQISESDESFVNPITDGNDDNEIIVIGGAEEYHVPKTPVKTQESADSLEFEPIERVENVETVDALEYESADNFTENGSDGGLDDGLDGGSEGESEGGLDGGSEKFREAESVLRKYEKYIK